jgi:hypothetical protein
VPAIFLVAAGSALIRQLRAAGQPEQPDVCEGLSGVGCRVAGRPDRLGHELPRRRDDRAPDKAGWGGQRRIDGAHPRGDAFEAVVALDNLCEPVSPPPTELLAILGAPGNTQGLAEKQVTRGRAATGAFLRSFS